MTMTIHYDGHILRFQHVSDCVQLLIDDTLVGEHLLARKHQWDDFELDFPTDFGEFKYGVHMGIFHDTVTVRIDDQVLRQWTMSLADFITLRDKAT